MRQFWMALWQTQVEDIRTEKRAEISPEKSRKTLISSTNSRGGIPVLGPKFGVSYTMWIKNPQGKFINIYIRPLSHKFSVHHGYDNTKHLLWEFCSDPRRTLVQARAVCIWLPWVAAICALRDGCCFTVQSGFL